MFLLMIWLLMAIGCAVIANAKNRSGVGWFLIGTIFGIFALIVIACLPRETRYLDTPQGRLASGRARKCPECAELVQPEAKICRYCGHRFNEIALGPDEELPEHDLYEPPPPPTAWQKIWWDPHGGRR